MKIGADLYSKAAAEQLQFSNSLVRDVESPLHKNFESHAARVSSSEKANAESTKKISEEIRYLEKKCSKKMGKAKDPNEYQKKLAELSQKGNLLEKVKQDYFTNAVEEEKRNFSFILQKCSVLVKSDAAGASQLAKIFEEQVYALLQLAFSPDSENPLPKELADQYVSGKAARVSIVQDKRPSISSKPIVLNDSVSSFNSLPAEVQSSKSELNEKEPVASKQNHQEQVIRQASEIVSQISSESDKVRENEILDENIKEEIEVEEVQTDDTDDSDSENENDEFVRCTHAFESRDEREMSIEVDQLLRVKRKEPNWYYCVDIQGNCGWIPSSYTQPSNAEQ